MRWRLADEEIDGQPALFSTAQLVGPEPGTGRLSGLEFLPVTTRRIINSVPAGSRMPFRHTINVYRGCSHACTYCLVGETPILMANGRVKALSQVRVDDEVVGTRCVGAYRRYVVTRVRDHWSTTRRAFRVTLADGTVLLSSGDHRFLTERGWKHVDGGTEPRPRLTLNDSLLGVGHLQSDPVTTRKRTIDGMAIRSDADLRVRSVEDLAISLPMFDITTGTGDFIANGVVSHNCFARPTHAYLGMDIGADFDRRIVVKTNAVERLKVELRSPSWTGETIAMGTNTDPYQRCEGKYRLTRGVVEVLTEHGNPFSILTKSALVTRDLDLIARASRNTAVSVNFSIATLDERVWRATEPGTPHPRRRLDAMRRVVEAGIACGALIASVLPGLSDSPAQLAEVAAAVHATGARILSVMPLHLRPGVREHFLAWLEDFDADLHARYLRHYSRGAYAPKTYADRLRALVDRPAP